MALFEVIRISFSPRDDMPLFGATEGAVRLPRDILLSRMFSSDQTFMHRNQEFFYTQIVNDGRFFCGVITRRMKRVLNRGPMENFERNEEEDWPLSYIFIDIDSGSQIVLFQRSQAVQSPLMVLRSFVKCRKMDLAGWNYYVEALVAQSNFWDVVAAYKGRITSLRFIFIPPNALRAEEAADLFVRAAQEANPKEVKVALDNDEGQVKPDTPFGKGCVETASRGGGKYTMKNGKKIIFDSTKNPAVEPIDDLPNPTQGDRSLLDIARRILGGRKW